MSNTKTFQHVPGPFGGPDTMKTQESFVEFVGGTARADRLDRLCHSSYTSGSAYDQLMKNGRYRTKRQNFTRKALAEGFTQAEIDAYWNLP